MSVNYQTLVNEALNMLTNDENLFIEVVDELDNYDGFADGFRAYPMSMLNDYYYGVPAIQLLDDMTNDFSVDDSYFYFSFYGLESCSDVFDLYSSRTSANEVFDNAIDQWCHLCISDAAFNELMESIINFHEA